MYTIKFTSTMQGFDVYTGGGEMLNVNHSKCYDKASSSTFRLDNSYEGDIVASQISVVENRSHGLLFFGPSPMFDLCLTASV